MITLLRHALALAGNVHFEAAIPKSRGVEAPSLALLRELGFKAWFDWEADMFAYEQDVVESAEEKCKEEARDPTLAP